MVRRLSKKLGLAAALAAPLLALAAAATGIHTVCESPLPTVPCEPSTVVHPLWGWTLFAVAAALAVGGAATVVRGRGTLVATARDTRRAYVALLVFCLGAGLLAPVFLTPGATTCTAVIPADGATYAAACPGPGAAFVLATAAAVGATLAGAWGLAYRGALAVATWVSRDPAGRDTV